MTSGQSRLLMRGTGLQRPLSGFVARRLSGEVRVSVRAGAGQKAQSPARSRPPEVRGGKPQAGLGEGETTPEQPIAARPSPKPSPASLSHGTTRRRSRAHYAVRHDGRVTGQWSVLTRLPEVEHGSSWEWGDEQYTGMKILRNRLTDEALLPGRPRGGDPGRP